MKLKPRFTLKQVLLGTTLVAVACWFWLRKSRDFYYNKTDLGMTTVWTVGGDKVLISCAVATHRWDARKSILEALLVHKRYDQSLPWTVEFPQSFEEVLNQRNPHWRDNLNCELITLEGGKGRQVGSLKIRADQLEAVKIHIESGKKLEALTQEDLLR
ncbi:hypothetical protein [Adhaeretor mobilis]|nr:hypothetical protein [Adhaeretor mobilis]